MGFSKLTKFYVVNVWFMDDCVGGGGGGGGKGVQRSGVRRCFVLVFARMRQCDLIEYKKLQFLKLLFVYLRNLGVLRTRLNVRSTSNQNLLVFDDRGENRSVRWKASRSKGENQQQPQLKYGVYPGCLRRDLNPGAIIDGRGVRVSRLLQPCSPDLLKYVIWKEITR